MKEISSSRFAEFNTNKWCIYNEMLKGRRFHLLVSASCGSQKQPSCFWNFCGL